MLGLLRMSLRVQKPLIVHNAAGDGAGKVQALEPPQRLTSRTVNCQLCRGAQAHYEASRPGLPPCAKRRSTAPHVSTPPFHLFFRHLLCQLINS